MQVSITASTELQVREAHLLEAVNETLRACVELRSATLNMTPLECGGLTIFYNSVDITQNFELYNGSKRLPVIVSIYVCIVTTVVYVARTDTKTLSSKSVTCRMCVRCKPGQQGIFHC